jgi:hypothetical protein
LRFSLATAFLPAFSAAGNVAGTIRALSDMLYIG